MCACMLAVVAVALGLAFWLPRTHAPLESLLRVELAKAKKSSILSCCCMTQGLSCSASPELCCLTPVCLSVVCTCACLAHFHRSGPACLLQTCCPRRLPTRCGRPSTPTALLSRLLLLLAWTLSCCTTTGAACCTWSRHTMVRTRALPGAGQQWLVVGGACCRTCVCVCHPG